VGQHRIIERQKKKKKICKRQLSTVPGFPRVEAGFEDKQGPPVGGKR
jgi:hypothetical protein